jgi:PGF-CTERM protein
MAREWVAMKAAVVALLVLASLASPAVAADATLTVSVVDDSGSTVAGAELTAEWDGGSTTATTASNGKAFVDVPEDENVTLQVEHDDYVRNHPVEIIDAEEDDIEVTVYEKAEATASVVDGNGPVADAQVRFVKDDRLAASGETDADGEFSTGTIEAGEYTVRVEKAGYYVERTSVSVENDTTTEVAVERGSVVVDFNVTDDHFEPPRAVAGATVTVDGFGSVNTLDDGQNSMRLPVNTQFSVSVGKDGYEEDSGSVAVAEESRLSNFTIQRAPSLALETVSDRVVAGERVRLEVTDEYGAPVTDAAILLDGEEIGETDDDGVLLATVETGGEHELRATKGSLESDAATIEAIGGETPTATPEPTPAETSTPTPEETGVGMPGFEFAVALVGLALAVLLFTRRRP